MKILGGILLALIALFIGGCSLFFGLNDLFGQGLGAYAIWMPGLLIGGFAAWGAKGLLFGSPTPKPTATPTDAPPPDAPPPPGKRDNWG